MKPLDHLRQLILEEQRLKYPTIPNKMLRVNIYQTDKPEKREKKRIEKFLNLVGNARCNIIENRGQRIDNRKTVTDVLGRKKVIGSVHFIGSGMRNGIADMMAVINGRAYDIELKRVYAKGKDRQSEEQKDEQKRMESAGGTYLIVTSFEDFYEWYKINITDLQS